MFRLTMSPRFLFPGRRINTIKYRLENTNIMSIKPISIYSQDNDKKTKVTTILPEERILTISDVKSKIEKQYGLSFSCQIIYMENGECDGEKEENNVEILEDYVSPHDMPQSEIMLYLTVDCMDNENLLQICKQHEIKVLDCQIITESGKVLIECPIGRETDFRFLMYMLEKKYELPQAYLIFHDTEFEMLFEQNTVIDGFEKNWMKGTCIIYLVVQTQGHCELSELCERLNIPQVSSIIVIKSLDTDEELCRVDVDGYFFEEFWYCIATNEIAKKLNLYHGVVLSMNGEILDRECDIAQSFWHCIYFEAYDGILKEVVFHLTFEPTMNEKILKFCKNHNIIMLETVKVKFLTGELDIDVRKETINFIFQLQTYISNMKNIPVCTLNIIFKGEILSEDESLMSLFVQEENRTSCIEFLVVVKVIDKVEVRLHSPYTKQLLLPTDHIIVPATQKLCDLKEEIASVTGLSVRQIRIAVANDPDVDSPVKDLVENESTDYHIDVTIWKTVTVRANDNTSTVHDIANDDETINDLLARIHLGEDLKFQERTNMSLNTILHDLRADDFIELKGGDKISCKIM